MADNLEKQKSDRFFKLYPWYGGLTADLLFWVAIDSLFFTVVRGLSYAQIVSLASVSVIGGIILQAPCLFIIKKVGNTASVRIGTFLLFVASLLYAFGPDYYFIAAGKVFYETAFTFRNMGSAMLENNLRREGRGGEFIKYRTKANTIYAVITMIISFVAGILFNVNHFLPGILASVFCLLAFALSFYMVDYSEKYGVREKAESEEKHSEKLRFSGIIVLILLSFGLFYPIANSGQSNGKLLIQDVLMDNVGVDNTSLILSGILAVSRIVRVVSNLLFYKVHIRFKNKVGIALPVLLTLSLVLFVTGFLLPLPLVPRLIIMSLGYLIILFIRDPYKVFAEDVMLKTVPVSSQQSMLTALDFVRKIIRAVMSVSFAALLTSHPLILIIFILFGLSLAEIVVSILLYRKVGKAAEKS